jgi:pimeloyl-ACP methyl ester carboxylesterase
MTRMPSARPGERPPRLVLVHGSRMSAAEWDGYADLLPGVEVVAPDLPGHGGRRAEAFDWDAAVATVRRAVEEAGGRTTVLAGHSLGGYVALGYAAQHPERLDGLVLVGATGEPSGAGAAVYRRFARLALAVGPERMGRVASGLMRRLGAPAGLAAELSDGTGYDTLPVVWEAVMANARAELLAGVTCPVTLVNGQFDQMRLDLRRFVRHAPHARVVTVPRTTHLLPLTHPETLATELRRALDAACP